MQIRYLLSLPLNLEWPNDLIGWIRQKLSKLWKHQSYHKVKRAKRCVNLNAEKCIFTSKNQFVKVKSSFKRLPTSHPREGSRMAARRQQNKAAQGWAIVRKILNRASNSRSDPVTWCNVDSPETLAWANCNDENIGTNEKTC